MLSTLLLAFVMAQAEAAIPTTTTLPVVLIAHSASASHLSINELEIKEDGKPLNGVTMKKRDENDPFLWIILLDASGSQRAEFERKRSAAIRFTESLVRPQDKVVAVTYTDPDHLEVNGKDGSKSEAIDFFRTSSPKGTTAVFDALYVVADFSLRFNLPSGNAALIHFGDGEDNASFHKAEESITKLQECNVAVFPIFLNRSNGSERGTNFLGKLAKETGGLMLSIDKDHGVDEVARLLESLLRKRLLLSYPVSPTVQTSKKKPTKHSIEIESSRKDLEFLYQRKRIEYGAKQ